MDEIDPSLLASYQIKRWSIRYYLTQCFEGHALLLREVTLYLRRCWTRLILGELRQKRSQDEKRRPQDQDHVDVFLPLSNSRATLNSTGIGQHNRPRPVISEALKLNEDDATDTQATTLKYGIVILSKLTHLIGLWIPSFTLDINLDLQMSKCFAILSHFQMAAFFIIGLVVAKWVLEPSLVQILDRIAPSVMQVYTTSVLFSEICYLSYGLLSCSYIVYQRNFIQDFFLYRCTIITLPRGYQRRKIVSLFLALYVFAFTSEPLYALLSLYYDLQQPKVWPDLSRGWFHVAKWATMAMTSFSASLLSSCGILIPIMTCFLMLASAQHLKLTMEKQLLRYRRVACSGAGRYRPGCKGRSSSQLEALLDDRTRKIIDDHSCHTLTMDWPELVNTRKTGAHWNSDPEAQTTIPFPLAPSTTTCSTVSSSPPKTTCCSSSSSSSSSLSSSSSKIVQNKSATALVPGVVEYASQQQLNASASGLMFLYKNLLKNMSEIKQMIRLWESKFANFHLISTLINSLIVNQWITAAFMEARSRNSIGPGGTVRAITVVGSYSISPFVVRIIGGVLTFIISNIYIMLWCDCLSRRLIKIKAQLFKMNIDLTNAHVLAGGPPHEPPPCAGAAAPSVAMVRQHNRAAAGPILGEYAEIDQIWSLYDQVDRLASTCLFKFSSDTYYTKRCLLLIFGRSVSVLLLFIQIIEMYSYTRSGSMEL